MDRVEALQKSPTTTRTWRDAVAMLRSIACCEATLAASGLGPHQWERKELGDDPSKGRRAAGSGGKTRGTMGRSRSGERIARKARVAHWERLHPKEVRPVSESLLWEALRMGTSPTEWRKRVAAPMSRTVFLSLGPLKNAFVRPVTEPMVQEVAGWGSCEAVAILLLLLMEERQKGALANALLCAQYLPATIALLSRTPGGRKIALPVLAMLRHRHLDALQVGGNSLDLAHCDPFSIAASADGMQAVELALSPHFRSSGHENCRSPIAPRILEWLTQHRVELTPRKTRSSKWQYGLGPSTHPFGPHHEQSPNKLHPAGQGRLREALDVYY